MNYEKPLKTALIPALVFLTVFYASAQMAVTDSARILFHQSKTGIDLRLGDNRGSLRRLAEGLDSLAAPGSPYVLKEVRVEGSASPEGGKDFNEYLSRKRAERIFSLLCRGTETSDSLLSFRFAGRNWRGLADMMRGDSAVPFHAETLALVERIVSAQSSGALSPQQEDSMLSELKRLHGGAPYAYLYSNIFPLLRFSDVTLRYVPRFPLPELDPRITAPALPLMALNPVPELIMPQTSAGTVKECRNFYMGLRTNLLQDALLLPSLGVEFYLGKNLSIVGNVMYGWWDKDSSHRYWRAYGGDLGLRWWFGRAAHEKPLTGHHIGLYGGIVTFDFEFGGRGYMGGKPHGTIWDRCLGYGGIEYGYSLPVARRLNIDFTVGVGYLSGKVIRYVPKNNVYVWQDCRRVNWIGPTKAEISLVWLIGCGNRNAERRQR